MPTEATVPEPSEVRAGARSLIPPVLAAAFVLIGATGFVDTADHQLVASVDGQEAARVCAKSWVACETALDAVRSRMIFLDLGIDRAELWCEPARVGECFDQRSKCIAGYNCPAGVR